MSEEEDCARDILNGRSGLNTAVVDLPQLDVAEEKSIQDYDREIREQRLQVQALSGRSLVSPTHNIDGSSLPDAMSSSIDYSATLGHFGQNVSLNDLKLKLTDMTNCIDNIKISRMDPPSGGGDG